MKVDFIIAGAQKCGTTALHHFLSKHPKVIGSDPKELDFFNYDVNFNKGFEYYHSHFPKPKLHQLRGFKFFEATPSYVNDRNVHETIDRMSKYNPKIKIIISVRDPIKRAYSAWQMYRKWIKEDKTDWWFDWMKERNGERPKAIKRTSEEYDDFYAFVERELASLDKGEQIESPVLKNGLYHKGIRAFKEKFDEQLLVLKNEDLNNNTPEELTKIANFLKLKPFNWDQFDSQKVLKGSYNSEMSNEVQIVLQEYYQTANEQLFNLTGIDYR